MKNELPVVITGHCVITDDLGRVLLNKENDVHPENMARVISRALSHEDNCWIDRIAFGNGGTYHTRVNNVDIVNYRLANDGIRDKQNWLSTLYNETYSESVDIKPGTGDGSAIAIIENGESNEPISTDHTTSGIGCVSIDKDRISQVVISCTLNRNEVVSQIQLDHERPDHVGKYHVNGDAPFIFDELGLYTSGAPLYPTSGYQYVILDNKRTTDICIKPGRYYFSIVTDDNNTPIKFSVTVGAISFAELVAVLNTTVNPSGITVTMSEGTTDSVVQTYGNIKFTSTTTGSNSTINVLKLSRPDWLFAHIDGFVKVGRPVFGDDAAYKDDPFESRQECSRLLTHLIFSPILKTSNRILNIKYTLTVYVERTKSVVPIDIIKPYITKPIVVSYVIFNIDIQDDKTGNSFFGKTIQLNDPDLRLFLNNVAVAGDVFSIGGVAVDNLFVNSRFNFKPILPADHTALPVKASVVTSGSNHNSIDSLIESEVDISFTLSGDECPINSLSIFANGRPTVEYSGSQKIKFTACDASDDSTLKKDEIYSFAIAINGHSTILNVKPTAKITTYEMLVDLLNTILRPLDAYAEFNDGIVISSSIVGLNSNINIVNPGPAAMDWLLANLPNYDSLEAPVAGLPIWDPNSIDFYTNSPKLLASADMLGVTKPAGAVYNIRLTLQVTKW